MRSHKMDETYSNKNYSTWPRKIKFGLIVINLIITLLLGDGSRSNSKHGKLRYNVSQWKFFNIEKHTKFEEAPT